MKLKIFIIFMALFSSICSADQITMPQYSNTSTLTGDNLNQRWNLLTNVLNGGIDNTNIDNANGFRLHEILGSLPANGNQGRTVFLTTNNTLYFDTGTTWITVAVLPNNQTFTGDNTFSGTNSFSGTNTFSGLAYMSNLNINGNWTAASQTCSDLGTISTANIDGGTIDGIQLAGATTTGSIFYNDASDNVAVLVPGASGTYLGSNGTSSIASFKIPPGYQSGYDYTEITEVISGAQSGVTVRTTAETDYVFWKSSSISTLYVRWETKHDGAGSGTSMKIVCSTVEGVGKNTTTSYVALTDTLDISGLTNDNWYHISIISDSTNSTTIYTRNVYLVVY